MYIGTGGEIGRYTGRERDRHTHAHAHAYVHEYTYEFACIHKQSIILPE